MVFIFSTVKEVMIRIQIRKVLICIENRGKWSYGRRRLSIYNFGTIISRDIKVIFLKVLSFMVVDVFSCYDFLNFGLKLPLQTAAISNEMSKVTK